MLKAWQSLTRDTLRGTPDLLRTHMPDKNVARSYTHFSAFEIAYARIRCFDSDSHSTVIQVDGSQQY